MGRWSAVMMVCVGFFSGSELFAKVRMKEVPETPAPVVSGRCDRSLFQSGSWITASVESTTDGDTIRVIYKNVSYPIRMLTIDTPETHYNGMTQGLWGENATARLAELLPAGTRVSIELGAESCDSYGRILGYVWKGRSNVNYTMVREGLAINYCIYPNLEYCNQFAVAAERSMRERLGFHADPSVEIPYEWRRQVSGREHEKPVTSIDSYDVHEPNWVDRIPIPKRLFFLSASAVQPPYHLEE